MKVYKMMVGLSCVRVSLLEKYIFQEIRLDVKEYRVQIINGNVWNYYYEKYIK